MAENNSSRRATSGRVGSDLDSTAKFFQDELGMSPEKSRKAAKELLDIITKQHREYSRIVTDLSDIEKLQTKYLDDSVKLTNVLSEQSVESQQQIELLQKKISASTIGSDIEKDLQSQLEQQLEVQEKIKEARDEATSHLNEEQKYEAELYESAYKRQSIDESRVEALREERKILDTQINALKQKDKLTDKEKEKLKKLEKDKRDKTREEKEVVSKRESSTFKGFIDDDSKLGKSINSAKESYAQTSDAIASKFEGALGKTMGKVAGAITALGGIMEAGLNKLNAFVDSAASFLADTKGNVNALLKASEKAGEIGEDYFSNFLKVSEEYLAAGTLITQKEYLSAIKQIAAQGVGITKGLETAAVLTAIAEKTVPQFNATNESLRRLVRLGDTQATQKFFGLEAILIRSLNHQFGDTSYLNQLFDSVNQTMVDAVANLNGSTIDNSYQFRSVLQQWMASLYEQGVDSNTINRITTSINALGSGNVNALSSDAGMQKLLLLSLDKAGQDFATILQEGLSADVLNTILTNMASYLKDLVGKTNKNNVLESAYANLFGLSMTDMYAFGKAEVKNPSYGEGEELAETSSILTQVSDTTYTMLSEKIDNALQNLQFTFGQNIANSTAQYGIWKGANLAMDIGGAVGGIFGKGLEIAGRAVLVADALPALAKTAYHAIAGGLDAVTSGENSVKSLYDAVANNTGATSEKGYDNDTFKAITSNDKNTKLDGDAGTIQSEQDKYVTKQTKLENEGGEQMKILKELQKTFMKDKNDNMAIAVSLQSMEDEVLKSFASIFADEDSMTDVFKKKKDREKLFEYDGETTSNSDDKDDKNDK